MTQQCQKEKQDLLNLVQGLQKWLLTLAPIVLKIADLFQRNERLSQPYFSSRKTPVGFLSDAL